MSVKRDQQKLLEANQDSLNLKTMVEDVEKQRMALVQKCEEEREAAEDVKRKHDNATEEFKHALSQEQTELYKTREQLEGLRTELTASCRSNQMEIDALNKCRAHADTVEHEMLRLQEQALTLRHKCKESEAQVADAHKIHMHLKQEQQKERETFDASSETLTAEFEDKMVRLLNGLQIAKKQSAEARQQLQQQKSTHKQALEKLLELQRLRNEEHKSSAEASAAEFIQLKEQATSQQQRFEAQLREAAGEATERLSALAATLNREHRVATEEFKQRLTALKNENELQAARHTVVLASTEETHARAFAHAQSLHHIRLQAVQATGRAEAEQQQQQQQQQQLAASGLEQQVCSWRETCERQMDEVRQLRSQLGDATSKLQHATNAQQIELFNQELKQVSIRNNPNSSSV